MAAAAGLEQILERARTGELTLYAWGAIRHFAVYAWRLPWRFAGIIDNSPEKWGGTVQGLPILPPSALADLDPARVAVMIMPYAELVYDEIERQIAGLGPFACLPYMPADEIEDRLSAAGRRAPLEMRLAAALTQQRMPASDGQGICLALGRLAVGGAERQMIALADGLRRTGRQVSIVVHTPEPISARHYLADLAQAGIDYRLFDMPAELPSDRVLTHLLAELPPEMATVLRQVPPFLIYAVVQFWRAFRTLRPGLVISYLDPHNSAAAIAALLAGVPRIVISGRNSNPSEFPYYFRNVHAAYRAVYKAVLEFPEVTLTANSRSASASYADWLGLDRDRVPVVHNALGRFALAAPTADARGLLAQRFGFDDTAKLVLGVFRLAQEKAPLDFVAVVEALYRADPAVRAVICGEGPMRSAIAAEAARRGIGDVVALAGVMEDLPALYRRADLMLHTARHEGLPNAIMEAQAFGCPVVATRAGGTPDCLSAELLPYLAEPGDIAALTAGCRRLLETDGARAALRRSIEAETRQRFSVERLVAGTLAAAGLPVFEDA